MNDPDTIKSLVVGSGAAYATLSDTLGVASHTIDPLLKTVSEAPDNWDSMEKALVSMGVACVSQLVLTLTPKLFNSILNLFKKSKNERSIKKQNFKNSINSGN